MTSLRAVKRKDLGRMRAAKTRAARQAPAPAIQILANLCTQASWP